MFRIITILLCIVHTASYATVKIVGLTIPLNIEDVENITVTSEDQAKFIAITITKRLHNEGYTTSYVEYYRFEHNECILYVKESRIQQIRIIGDVPYSKKIYNDLQYLEGKVYNRNIVNDVLQQIKNTYSLDSLQANVVNYNNTDDVCLEIKVRVRRIQYACDIGTHPIYGTTIVGEVVHNSPLITIIGRGNISFLRGNTTFRKGSIEYLHLSRSLGFRAGVEAMHETLMWEEDSIENSKKVVQPFIGFGLIRRWKAFDLITFFDTLFLHYKISDFHSKALGVQIGVRATNQNRSLAAKHAYYNATLFFGSDDNKYTSVFRVRLQYPLLIINRIYFIPTGYSFTTNSHNRVFLEYVYDDHFPAYEHRYTVSNSRHIAGMHYICEIVYEILFLELFVRYGIFKNMNRNWEKGLNYGASFELHYNTLALTLGYSLCENKIFTKGYVYGGVRASL